jgi:hypothetical protein
VLFELPVPFPPEMLAVSCEPDAVLPVFAVPAALPFVPLVPALEPSVLLPVPIELDVVPVVAAPVASLVEDEPPAPSVALKLPPPPLPEPLETPAPVPAEPPLLADTAAPPVELLWPEFSLLRDPAAAFGAADCSALPALPPCTNVPA